MKNKISRRSFLAAAAVSAAALAVSGCDAKMSKKEVTDITVWNYYNGDQLESFNRLVSTFNETIGKAKGIRVTGSSQGTVNDLEANVMDAAEGKVGSAEMPTIFAAYADTAYKLDQMGMVVDLKDYLTEDEKAAFVPGYITEGDFDGSGSIKIFPVAKSTELMFFNDTDWQRFAKETFVRYGALSTMEGVTAVAEQYYNWSGGKALFGRDALANYMIVGAKQLGCEIFEVHNGKMTLHFDRDVVRKLWDNYYVPFVKGYFVANGRFRSDDVKTGALLGCVPQCGFSAVASNFYASRVITPGTLLAVFIATSDEAIPLLAAEPSQWTTLVLLIVCKIIFAIVGGVLLDFPLRKVLPHSLYGGYEGHADEVDCHEEHEETSSIFLAALRHTLEIFVFILLFSFLIGLIFKSVGEDAITGILGGMGIFQPMLTALGGLVPNCAASVLLAQLYMEGAITFGSLFAGLTAGAGVGLAVLWRVNPSWKQNLFMTGLLWAVGAAAGMVLQLIL